MPVFHFYRGAEYIGKREATREEAAAIKARHGWEDGVAPEPEPGTEDEVRAEALRRIDAIADRRKQMTLVQRTLRLFYKVMIEQEPLTQSEQAEIATERAVTEQIEVMTEAEKALLAMDPIPADYADDKWWTA